MKKWLVRVVVGCAVVGAATTVAVAPGTAQDQAAPQVQCWVDVLADVPPADVYAGAASDEDAMRHAGQGAAAIGRAASERRDRESIGGDPEVAQARTALFARATRAYRTQEGHVVWELREDGQLHGLALLQERDSRWFVVSDHVLVPTTASCV